MQKKKNRISSDTIISYSAIIIAVASIVVTIWQGIETRRHYRLSVRPKLEITFSSNKESFGYILTNNGLGPAIITKKKIFVDGEEISYSGFSEYDDLINKLNLNDRKISHSGLYSGKTIKADDKLNIIRFSLNAGEKPDSLIREVYGRVGMEISYKSMYDEKFTCRVPN